MIIRPAPEGAHLITQPDHAALARRIMERWIPLDRHPRRDLVLDAVEHHDDGWAELDAAPQVDPASGGVADFVHLDVGLRQALWPRGAARAAERHPWTGALVAHHAVFVYQRYATDPGWREFFAHMSELRHGYVRASGWPEAMLADDYRFVRLGDLASLAFCTADTRFESHGDVDIHLDGDRVDVRPDPFGGAEVPLAVAARLLRAQTFPSDAALRRACAEAEPVMLRGRAGGAAPTTPGSDVLPAG